MKKTKIIICAVLAFSVFIPTGLATNVYAMGKEVSGWFRNFDTKTNNFGVATVDIDTEEPSFTPPSDWGGSDYPKVVKVKNNSTGPALIRVSINPRWVDKVGEKENPWAGDVSYIELKYSTNDKWKEGSDGYYYYTEIVPTGQSTEAILDSVQLNIPENLKAKYKGKTVIIDVDSEAVQATQEGYKATWGNVPSNIEEILNGLCKGR